MTDHFAAEEERIKEQAEVIRMLLPFVPGPGPGMMDEVGLLATAPAAANGRLDGAVIPDGRGESDPEPVPYFARLLQLAGLRGPQQLAMGNGWELWRAKESPALALKDHDVAVILLTLAPTESRLREVSAQVRDTVPARHRAIAVLQGKASTAPEAIVRVSEGVRGLGEVDTWNLPALARGVCTRLQRTQRAIYPRDQYFVEPMIESAGSGPGPALEVLARFLAAGGESGGGVGVLRAPGGVGKSTVVRELCHALLERTRTTPIYPVLVTDEHWVELEMRGTRVSEELLLRESLHAHGFTQDDLGQIDVLLAHGAAVLVFDSFDEVLSRGAGASPNSILSRVLSLATLPGSKARMLITSRPESWALVDQGLRSQCTLFELHGFTARQEETYLRQRFGSDERSVKAVKRLLDRLDVPELRASPLTLALFSEAVTGHGGTASELEECLRPADPVAPLLPLARLLCRSEQSKHQLTLDASTQLGLFGTILTEFGSTFSLDDLALVAAADCGVPPGEAERFRYHMLLVEHGGRHRLRYREFEEALFGAQLGAGLRLLARAGELDAAALGHIDRVLRRAASSYGDLLDRVGARLPRREFDLTARTQAWRRRSGLSPPARGALFRSLLVDVHGLREPQFLELVDGLRRLSDVEFTGRLQTIDFRAVQCRSVRFASTDIEACRFDALSSFAGCTFSRCAIGYKCQGLTPDALRDAHADQETVLRSKAWAQFPQENPVVIAELALKRVLRRLLELRESGAQTSVFSTRAFAQDDVEQRGLDILRTQHVVAGRGADVELHDKVIGDVRRYVAGGEPTGAVRRALSEMQGLPYLVH